MLSGGVCLVQYIKGLLEMLSVLDDQNLGGFTHMMVPKSSLKMVLTVSSSAQLKPLDGSWQREMSSPEFRFRKETTLAVAQLPDSSEKGSV